VRAAVEVVFMCLIPIIDFWDCVRQFGGFFTGKPYADPASSPDGAADGCCDSARLIALHPESS